MTTPAASISILAAVTPDERCVVEAAAKDIADALSEASGQTWTCPCDFTLDLSAISETPTTGVIITSLGVPLAFMEQPWEQVEQRLRASYAVLCQIGVPVMICTVLRHVSVEGDPAAAARKLRRLRQLNSLATKLSHEYGAVVIDLDRILADIGAHSLNTDYRLRGAAVAGLASNAIARSIVSNALDVFVSVEVQDAACAVLEKNRPAIGPAPIAPTNLMSMGKGRRKQLVSTVTNMVQEEHVGWLVRQFLTRQIGPGEAFAKFFQAVRRRGARQSALLLISGFAQMFRSEEMRPRR
jgi:hypothetical protein